MVKKRGTAEEGPGRRPPRRSRGQRAKPAETARRAVWPAAVCCGLQRAEGKADRDCRIL